VDSAPFHWECCSDSIEYTVENTFNRCLCIGCSIVILSVHKFIDHKSGALPLSDLQLNKVIIGVANNYRRNGCRFQ
jgi:hypothetical protein